MKWISSQMCVSPNLIGCCAKTPRSPKVVPEDNLDIGIWKDDDDNGNDPRDCEQTIRGKMKTLKTHRQQYDNDTHVHNMTMQTSDDEQPTTPKNSVFTESDATSRKYEKNNF